jgi:hypothetical protein
MGGSPVGATGEEQKAVSAAWRIARPTVLLLDDAETRTGLLAFLTDAAAGAPLPTTLARHNCWLAHSG